MSSNEGEPAKAAAAATVLLIRDRPAFEVLMVTRHEKTAFAAGALVFPGGKIADDDDDPRWQGLAQGWLDLTSEQRAMRVTAIREVFEETGLLISRSSGAINSAPDTATVARRAICEGRLGFLTFAREAGHLFDLAGLVPFAHWITPVFMPRRFDTHFFICGMETEQQPISDGIEVTDAEWINPREALRLGMAKQRVLALPTRLNLQLLAESSSVKEAISAARSRPVVTVQSRIEQRESGRVLTIRADAGYGVVEEPLSEIVNRGNA